MHIFYSAPDIKLEAAHGGSGHVEGVLSSLMKLGHRLTVLVQSDQAAYKGEKIIRFTRADNAVARTVRSFCIPFFTAFYYCVAKKTDLVYERAKIFGGGGVLAAWLCGKKSVYEMNEPIPFGLSAVKDRKEKLIERWHVWVAKHATIVTGTHESFFLNMGAKNTMIINYGTDPALFKPEETKEMTKMILYTGSFAPWHACDKVIEVAKRLVLKDKDVQFVLLGEGQQFELCKRLVAAYHLEKHVLLPGRVPHSEIPAYTQRAAICLALFDQHYPLFKRFDYFYSPIKVHEYKACGKPIIASNIGNLKKIVQNGKNGFLVDEQNVEEIEHAIVMLLQNKALYHTMSAQNRKDVVEEYNWDVINQKILTAVAER